MKSIDPTKFRYPLSRVGWFAALTSLSMGLGCAAADDLISTAEGRDAVTSSVDGDGGSTDGGPAANPPGGPNGPMPDGCDGGFMGPDGPSRP